MPVFDLPEKPPAQCSVFFFLVPLLSLLFSPSFLCHMPGYRQLRRELHLFCQTGLEKCTTCGSRAPKSPDFSLTAAYSKIWYLPALKLCTFSPQIDRKGANISDFGAAACWQLWHCTNLAAKTFAYILIKTWYNILY